ncbi:MAG: PEP-CTERM sorting domain-containing protein [Thalassotalea sp.]
MKNVVILFLGLFVSTAQADVINAFDMEYDTSNWVIAGDANFSDIDPVDTIDDTLTQISNDDISGSEFNTDTTIAAHSNGIVSFDWLYTTIDGPEFDYFGWLLEGQFTLLTDISVNAEELQQGSASFMVNVGDIFGFRTVSTDSGFGSSETIVSNFSFTEVPEPSSIAFFALACALISFSRKNKKA